MDRMAEMRQSYDEDIACKQGYKDYCRIRDSPWWTRAWVVQELAASRHATFVFGNDSIPSTPLMNFFRCFKEFARGWCNLHENKIIEVGSSRDDPCIAVWTQFKLKHKFAIAVARFERTRESRLPLSRILHSLRHQSASDGRDLM